jgi:regulator of replication initiation timing
MSAKPCDNCTMIMVNYADLWLVHSHIARLLDGARLELIELKAHSRLLGACTSYPVLRSNLEASAIEIKDLKHILDYASRYSVLSPLCKLCGSLKGKLFHATEENTELQQEIVYLTARLEKTVLSEKMVEDDLSRVEERATKSIYKLGVGFERCADKDEKSAPKFIHSSTYHEEEKIIKSTKAHYPSNTKPSFNPKREVRKETPKSREEAFVYMFYGRVGHLDEFCFLRKRIERRHFDYTRNSYCDEFSDFPPHSFSRALPHTSSRALPQFAHGSNHHLYGFGSRENRFDPRCFGYNTRPHRGDRFPCRPVFPAAESHTHLELRHLYGPHFLHHGSRPTRSSDVMQRIVKTSSGHMVKC